jgi:hypothetical protein
MSKIERDLASPLTSSDPAADAALAVAGDLLAG